MAKEGFAIIFVTVPNLKTARQLARAALTARLAACVNMVRGVESHYWWRGHMESTAEVQLLLKTQKKNVKALEKLVREQHPFNTAEFLVVPVTGGSKKYLLWLAENSRG